MTEILILAVLLVAAVIWLAMRNGRRWMAEKTIEDTLAAIRKAEEIAAEVEALPPDSLKARARTWVRGGSSTVSK